MFSSFIACLADIIFGAHVIRVTAPIAINFDCGHSYHFPNGFNCGVVRNGENAIELLILDCDFLSIILNQNNTLWEIHQYRLEFLVHLSDLCELK